MQSKSGDMIVLSGAGMRVLCMPYGSRLAGVWFDGWVHNLVLGSENPTGFHADDLQYFGAIVGPVANRISDAQVEIQGETWRMDANEGRNCLHSGVAGLHRQQWQTLECTTSHVVFGIHLPHGAGGLPGARDITATYRIEGRTLALEIEARSDCETLMNLAHHPYWNLSGQPTVSEHMLDVAARTFLPTDDVTCPTGEIEDVAGTLYDFTKTRAVPVRDSLDANLCLAEQQRETEEFAARLSAPNAPTLEIWTTEPGLQIYNGSGLPTMHLDQTIGPFAGLALEPQAWPDAPRHPSFPSILVSPDTPYRQRTSYHFSI